MQRRAARRPVEGAAQRLAVDGEHPVAGGAEIVEEGLEGAPEGGRIEQAEHPAEGVVARQAILQAQEFPQQRLAVLGELGEVDAALRAADRGDQRDRQDVEQLVPLRIAAPRVGDLSKRVDQRHASSTGHMAESRSAREGSPILQMRFPCLGCGAKNGGWRRRPESNRRARICNPLRNHSATSPRRRTPSSNAAAHRQGGKPRGRAAALPRRGEMCDPSGDPTAVEGTARMIDYAAAREAMVDRQVRTADVTRYPIIAAMLAVPREDFVPAALRPVAYLGEHVPLAPGRVLLDPRVFAKLLDALDVGPARPGARRRLRARLLDGGAGADGRGGGGARGGPGAWRAEAEALLAAHGGRQRGGAGRAARATACRSTGRSTRSWSRARSRCCREALADQLKPGGRIAAIFVDGARRPGAARARAPTAGIAWRRIFDATAPVLPGFAATKAFEF